MLGFEFVALYILLGCFVGVAAGLLGIGGGGIIVPSLTAIFLMQGVDSQNVVQYGTCNFNGNNCCNIFLKFKSSP